MKNPNASLAHSDGKSLPVSMWIRCGVCIGLVLMGVSAFPATNILVETFEGNFPEDNGWTVSGLTNSGGARWGKVDAGFGGEGTHGGDYKGYCAAYGYAGTYENPQYPSNIASKMSTTINLSNYNVATLTYWYRLSLPNGIYLNINIDNSPRFSLGWNSSQWQKDTIDLKEYVGRSVKIEFEFTCNQATNGWEGCYLDDITVTADYLTGAPGSVIQKWPNRGYIGSRNSLYEWADDPTTAPCAWYRLYVIGKGGQMVEDCWTTNCVVYPDQSKYPAGDYSWWVQGWNAWGLGPWSGPSVFKILTNLPAVPNIVQPTNGTVLTSPSVIYQCSYLDASWYELSILKNGAPYADIWTNKSYCQVPGHGSGDYSWRVRGWNADGMGPWSEAKTFSVSLEPVGVIEGLWPFGNWPLSWGGQHFDWHGSNNVDWYCLRIDCNGTNYLTKWIQNNNQSWYQLSNSLPVGSYSWRIAGWNSEGMGPWSTNCSLKVVADGTPFTPVGTYAATGGALWYYWYAGIDSTWYELCVYKDGGRFYDQWLSTNSLSAIGNVYWATCLTNAHAAGNYSWWVRPWSPKTGTGAWSSTGNFSLVPRQAAADR